jgi:hypothetical protein
MKLVSSKDKKKELILAVVLCVLYIVYFNLTVFLTNNERTIINVKILIIIYCILGFISVFLYFMGFCTYTCVEHKQNFLRSEEVKNAIANDEIGTLKSILILKLFYFKLSVYPPIPPSPPPTPVPLKVSAVDVFVTEFGKVKGLVIVFIIV